MAIRLFSAAGPETPTADLVGSLTMAITKGKVVRKKLNLKNYILSPQAGKLSFY